MLPAHFDGIKVDHTGITDKRLEASLARQFRLDPGASQAGWEDMKPQRYQSNLRELIKDNGYTFKEVSEETDISLSALFIYARGERPIPHTSRDEIARVIGCKAQDIVSKRQFGQA
jgi:hypothetical protein